MPAANRRAMLALLILSGVIISVGMGLRQSLGLFMRPITLDVGVSAAAFGFSLALQNIIWGFAQPVVGALADKHGARPVLIGTTVLYALGLGLMVFAGRVPGALEVAGFLTGVGVAGTGLGVLIGTVSRAAPPERRTQTVGIVAAAGSLGMMVLAPLGQWMIGAFSWQTGIIVFAVIAASMVLLAWPVKGLAMRLGAESAGGGAVTQSHQSLGEALRESMRHRGYVFMMIAFFACGFQLIFITTHLPAYLQLCGVAPGVGASALALIGLFNTVGTYMFGHLGARYSQKHLLALIYLLRTLIIGVFLLVPISPASTLVFAAAMGFLWLGVAPLVTGIIGRVFGLTHFNTLYGVIFLSHQVGSFFGAWMGGLVFDWTGRYDAAWAALIVIGLTAFTLQWLMDDRPPPVRKGTGAAVPAAA